MSTPLTQPITEDDIANYLASTPDFFERHAELLAAVHLTSPHHQRAVSLQERQAEMLREKIKVLENRLMDLLRHGNENLLLCVAPLAVPSCRRTSCAKLPAGFLCRRSVCVCGMWPQLGTRPCSPKG